MMETGANDVYVIDSKEHGEVLIPAIKECVPERRYGKWDAFTVHLMSGLIWECNHAVLYYDIISGHGDGRSE